MPKKFNRDGSLEKAPLSVEGNSAFSRLDFPPLPSPVVDKGVPAAKTKVNDIRVPPPTVLPVVVPHSVIVDSAARKIASKASSVGQEKTRPSSRASTFDSVGNDEDDTRSPSRGSVSHGSDDEEDVPKKHPPVVASIDFGRNPTADLGRITTYLDSLIDEAASEGNWEEVFGRAGERDEREVYRAHQSDVF